MGNLVLVKKFRLEAGISQAELARRTHVSSPNLSAVENGQRVAWPKLRRRLARALKVPETQLFPASGLDIVTDTLPKERLTLTLPELARLAGEAGSLERRLKALVDEIQRLEHDSQALRKHSCAATMKPAIAKPLTDADFDIDVNTGERILREDAGIADFDEVTHGK